MRELTETELDKVSGGAIPLLPVGMGAILGGASGAANYSVQASMTGGFTWGGLVQATAVGVASGTLLGAGGSMLSAAWSGVRGVAVAGGTAAGLGVAGGAAYTASQTSGGGSAGAD